MSCDRDVNQITVGGWNNTIISESMLQMWLQCNEGVSNARRELLQTREYFFITQKMFCKTSSFSMVMFKGSSIIAVVNVEEEWNFISFDWLTIEYSRD